MLLEALGREAEWHAWLAANRLALDILASNPQADGQSMPPPGWSLSRGVKHNKFTMPDGIIAADIKMRFEGANEVMAWVAYLHFLWVAQAEASAVHPEDGNSASHQAQASAEAEAALLREQLEQAETNFAAERQAHDAARRAHRMEVTQLRKKLELCRDRIRPSSGKTLSTALHDAEIDEARSASRLPKPMPLATTPALMRSRSTPALGVVIECIGRSAEASSTSAASSSTTTNRQSPNGRQQRASLSKDSSALISGLLQHAYLGRTRHHCLPDSDQEDE